MKDKNTAGILAIFLGGLGLHKFYLGQTGMGIVYILFCWTFIPAIVALIEGIAYFATSTEAFNKQYNSKEVLMEKAFTVSLENNSKPNNLSHLDELKKLKELLDLGAITQDEFDTEKAKLMTHLSQTTAHQSVALAPKKSTQKERKPMSMTFRIIVWILLVLIGFALLGDQNYKGVGIVIFIGVLLIPRVNNQLHSICTKIPKPKISNGALGVILVFGFIGFVAFIGNQTLKTVSSSSSTSLSSASSLNLKRIQPEDEFIHFIDKKIADIIQDLQKEGDKVVVKKEDIAMSPTVKSTKTIITIQRNGYRVQIDSKDFWWDERSSSYSIIPDSKKMPASISYWFENQTPCSLDTSKADINAIAESLGISPMSKGDSKEDIVKTKGFTEFRNTLGRSDLEFQIVCSNSGEQYYAVINKSYE